MVLQPAVRTAADVATGPGGLLHHLFTLTWPVPFERNARLRRLFSVTDAQTRACLAVSPVRRPVLPGLSSPSGSPSRAPEAAAEPPCFILYLLRFRRNRSPEASPLYRVATCLLPTQTSVCDGFISVSSPDGCSSRSMPSLWQTHPVPLPVCGRCSRNGPN